MYPKSYQTVKNASFVKQQLKRIKKAVPYKKHLRWHFCEHFIQLGTQNLLMTGQKQVTDKVRELQIKVE